MPADPLAAERDRILAENRRRARELPGDRYAPWDPAELFLRQDRVRRAARLLRVAGGFPATDAPCLEVGCGIGGWLADLLGWGVVEGALHGVELDLERLTVARRRFPVADLRVGDAAAMPWDTGQFSLVVASTVFTSILGPDVRRAVVTEMMRVLAPGGAVLWYDFRFRSPANPNVRAIDAGELRALFPGLVARVESAGLLPPIARRIAGRSWWLAHTLALLPILRGHLVAVLCRPAGAEARPGRPGGD